MAGRFVLPLSNLFNASGAVLANGTLTFYQTATSTPLDTYSDFALTVANTNPVTLDANGKPEAEIFLQAQAYKVVVKSSAGTILETYDPVWPAPGLTDANAFTKTQAWAKGADVASAANLTPAADGNFWDVTGTTAITSIDSADATIPIGTFFGLQFDGALTLTHHATNLILPGAANITTAAGDVALFHKHAAGDVRCFSYFPASDVPSRSGQPTQVVNTQTGAVATGTTQIPADDTIPQNTEGDEYMTLAITPKSASSTLLIEVIANVANSASAGALTIALFQDATAGALAAGMQQIGGAGFRHILLLRHKMTSGTTSATTFKIRIGLSAAGTTTFNGQAGTRNMGGVMASSITITEIAP